MGLVGSLWNQDVRLRLRRVHERLDREARSDQPPTARSSPQFQRRRPGVISDAIAEILGDRRNGMRMRDIAAAVSARLGDPVPHASVKSCLWREAHAVGGRFQKVGKGKYRLR